MADKHIPGPVIIPSEKIFYLDNIKVLLTVLVVVHHAFVAYGAPGGWYYHQVATNEHALVPLTVFTFTNQAFFMGLFFLISGYFIEHSLKRKGTKVYLLDRFKRLGIPLIFYALISSPFTCFLAYHFGMLKKETFIQYLLNYSHWIDFSGLWFLSALLIFALVFVALYNLKITGNRAISKLNGNYILLTGLCLGLITYFARISYPTDQATSVFGFHLGHFPQYIVMFIVGIVAGRGKLAEHLDIKLTKRFVWLAIVMFLIAFPLIIYVYTSNRNVSNLYGGANTESLIYSFYEQIIGISIIVAFTGILKYRWNTQSKFVSKLSRNALAVYIFHPIVLVIISLILSRFATTPTIKLAIAAPLAVICSFLFVDVVMRVPGVNRVI